MKIVCVTQKKTASNDYRSTELNTSEDYVEKQLPSGFAIDVFRNTKLDYGLCEKGWQPMMHL